MTNNFDFNDADKQKSFDVIPNNTIATVQMSIQPGGAGQDGWLTRATDGLSEHLNCSFTVVEGEHAKRKVFGRFTVDGTKSEHKEAGRISRSTCRAMLESARGIRFDDNSDTAKVARQIQGYQDFDGLRFVAVIGVLPPKNGYSAKNCIREVITPESENWTKPEQIDRGQLATNKPAAAQPSKPAANSIARPDWAE
jgi:hypothetical protein